MLIVSYGAGTNSTAMLVGMKERGIRPDHITFADTGGEKPHTYEHIEIMQTWLKDNDFPPITIVKKVDINGEVVTLEQFSLDNKMLPSLAYGFKQCSIKFKIGPQDRYFNNLPEAQAVWRQGDWITKCIGYDLDEDHRVQFPKDGKYIYQYPLVEWEWDRKECIEAIKREGLPLPGKSACFFCPASKQNEIRWLAQAHPDLMERALKIERTRNEDIKEQRANPTTREYYHEASDRTLSYTHLDSGGQVRGLGRGFRWEDVIATDDMFADNFIEEACGCYDG